MRRLYAREDSSQSSSSSNLATKDGGIHASGQDTSQAPLDGPRISRLPIAGRFSAAQTSTFLQRSLAGMGQVLARPSSDPASSGIQPKLKIGRPGDKYEQEADRVADQVMRTPEPRVQRQAANEEEEEGGSTCVSCFPQAKSLDGPAIAQRQAEEEEEEKPEVSARPLDGATVQRQADEGEEEEPEVSAKPLEASLVQRQAEEEEEEPEVSAKPLEGGTMQRQTDEESAEEEEPEVSAELTEGATTLQRQAEEGEEEEPEVSAKPLGVALQRQEEEKEDDGSETSARTLQSPTIRRQERGNTSLSGKGVAGSESVKNGKRHAGQEVSSAGANIHAFTGGGKPLSERERRFFEPRFGRDFSQVRIHSDGFATHAARSISAKAFTIGRDIAFGASQYSPSTHVGRRLLAHELAHVVQQNAAHHTVQQHNKWPVFRHAPPSQTIQRGRLPPMRLPPRRKTAKDVKGLALCKKRVKKPRAVALAIFKKYMTEEWKGSGVTAPTSRWGCWAKKGFKICGIENPLFRVPREDHEILIAIDTTKPASYLDPKEITVFVDEVVTVMPPPGAPPAARKRKHLENQVDYALDCFTGKIVKRKTPKGGRPPIKP